MNRRWIETAVVLVCAAFALRILGLIDATSLWSDELYSVGKSFQPSYSDLLAQLRQDTHPPLYYSLLWLWGVVAGQSGLSLRLLSWLAYIAGGLLMTRQAGDLAPPSQQRSALLLAALMAFCSPYPLRFSIEGKSYALLTALVALAWVVAATPPAWALWTGRTTGQFDPFLWLVFVCGYGVLGCCASPHFSFDSSRLGVVAFGWLDCLRLEILVWFVCSGLDRQA